jgi:predicted kinase
MNEKLNRPPAPKSAKCYLFIGPSGCGKSTQVAHVKASTNLAVHHYSWDALRLEWYSPNTGNEKADYQAAWNASTEDKAFHQKSEKAFVDMLDGNHVIVDNTNLTVKRRRFFADAARRKGYEVVGVLFPITIDELKRRHAARGDKTVPWETVKSMYMAVQLPSIGEADKVITVADL